MRRPSAESAGQFVFYLGLGVEHIIGGIDHLLFLLALLALATSLWQTVKIVTAFTVAHSITLSLAALGLVDVPSSIVEPLIAASIVWVAVENLVAPAGAARRWLIAGAFGLIHGLGFASALVELGLPRDACCGRWSASISASSWASSPSSPSSCRRSSGRRAPAACRACRRSCR